MECAIEDVSSWWRAQRPWRPRRLLAGCTVGPDFERRGPDIEATPATRCRRRPVGRQCRGGNRPALRRAPGHPAVVTLYESRPLSDLHRRGGARQPDLQSAQAALRQAQENAAADRGALWRASTSAPDRNASASQHPVGPAQRQASDVHALQRIGQRLYNVDVVGGTRRQIEASDARPSSRATARGELSRAHRQRGDHGGQRRLGTRADRRDPGHHPTSRQSLTLLQQQLALGGIKRSDVLTQEARLRQTEATRAPLAAAGSRRTASG